MSTAAAAGRARTAAWTAASATSWICAGADRIFHWETGTTLRNSTGDGRLVNFYEQWPWNMALLELFLGGLLNVSKHILIHCVSMYLKL